MSGFKKKYFYNGPEGSFEVSTLAFGEQILKGLGVDSDEWTATEMDDDNTVLEYVYWTAKYLYAQASGDEAEEERICDAELDWRWNHMDSYEKDIANIAAMELAALNLTPNESVQRIEYLVKELANAKAVLKEWDENAEYLLDTTTRAVRVREGGGLENLCHSISLNYIALRDAAGRKK